MNLPKFLESLSDREVAELKILLTLPLRNKYTSAHQFIVDNPHLSTRLKKVLTDYADDLPPYVEQFESYHFTRFRNVGRKTYLEFKKAFIEYKINKKNDGERY